MKDVIVIGEEIVPREQIFTNGLKAASGFHALGISSTDTIALLMRNDFPFFEASRGAAAIGAYAVPLNWHNKADEIAYVLDDSKPRVLVGHADLLLAVRDVIPADIELFIVPTEGSTADANGTIADLRETFPEAKVWADWIHGFPLWNGPAPAARSAILYTSGTTGRPKAVRKPAMNTEALKLFRELQCEMFGMGPGTRSMILGPLYHAMPDASGREAVSSAEIAIFQRKFDGEDVLRKIEQHKLTHIVMVPTAFVRLLKLPQEVRDRYHVSSLRSATHTGGPCPIDVKRAMIEWWGPIVNEVYGGTEMGCTFFCRSDDWLRFPGTAGRPIRQTRFAIVDDARQPVPNGTVGEVFARNPIYGDFDYVGRKEQRAEVEMDGLITLGDMGYVNDEGFLFLCDRKRDMVILGGVNVYPAEIESVLLMYDKVRDCAVFGIPDDDLGEVLLAAVQLKDGCTASEEEIRAFLKERLTNYKVPRTILFVDDLPREDSGKIFKRKLRDPYWAGNARRI